MSVSRVCGMCCTLNGWQQQHDQPAAAAAYVTPVLPVSQLVCEVKKQRCCSLTDSIQCCAVSCCGVCRQVLPEVRQVRFTQPPAAAAAPKAEAEASDAAAAADAGADSSKAGARPGSSGGKKGSMTSKSAKSKQKQRRMYYDTSSESDWSDSEVRQSSCVCAAWGADQCVASWECSGCYSGTRHQPACICCCRRQHMACTNLDCHTCLNADHFCLRCACVRHTHRRRALQRRLSWMMRHGPRMSQQVGQQVYSL